MMMPPVTTMVVPMMIVVTMASLGEIGLSAVPITQAALGLAVESSSVCRIISRPVALMRFTISCREDVSFGRIALVKSVSLT